MATLLQSSSLENPVDKGAWRASVDRVTKNQPRLKRLSTSVRASVLAASVLAAARVLPVSSSGSPVFPWISRHAAAPPAGADPSASVGACPCPADVEAGTTLPVTSHPRAPSTPQLKLAGIFDKTFFERCRNVRGMLTKAVKSHLIIGLPDLQSPGSQQGAHSRPRPWPASK